MRRSTSPTIALALVLASLTLTACGGSSPSNSTQTTGSAQATTAGGTASTSTGAATGTTGGSTGSKTTSTTGTGTAKPGAPKSGALKQALAGYEACMREHGVQVPLRTRGSSATSAEVQARKQALSACRPVLRAALHTLAHSERHTTPASPTHTGSAGSGTGSTGTTSSTSSTPTPTPTVPHIKPAATPAPVTAALKHFTACMHEHGITNFPEPEGASFNVSHVSLDRNSAQFKAAEKACNSILQAIG